MASYEREIRKYQRRQSHYFLITFPMTLQTNWNLTKYFFSGLDDPRLEENIASILPLAKDFASKYRNVIKTFAIPQQVLRYYADYETMSHEMGTGGIYLSYLQALDTQNDAVIKKMGELEYIFIQASSELLFVSQEWKELGYDRIMAFANDPLLVDYKNALVSMADNLRYILGEREEFVLNEKSRALGVVESLREELANSYAFEIELDGEKKTMTVEEIRSLRTSPDREIRRKSYQSLRQVYNNKQTQITLGNIYSGILKDWASDVKLRGYQTVMGPRNTSEELENEVVDMLLQEVQAAYPLFARFIEAKRKLLGLDEFHVYDTQAPLSLIEKEFTFEDGTRLHLETMKDFDQEFYDYSVDMFESGRIDAFPKYGKRSGAFASYRAGEQSFVLLNHTGKLGDVSTISHELGHATHGYLSQGQKPAVYDSPLSLAETASIFSEMLLSEKLRKELTPEEYKEFLNEKLSDVFATIFRQIQYIAFEKRAHEAIFAGEELTYHDFNRMWREEQIHMTGTSVTYDVDATGESGWSMIPHIFATPFYCYAYAFGNILVFALYNRYQKEGQSFVESYKNILRAGGSKRPRDLLAEHGFDITSPKFYRDAMEEVEKMVVEFEGMSISG